MSAITMSAALSTRVASIKRTSGAKAIKAAAARRTPAFARSAMTIKCEEDFDAMKFLSSKDVSVEDKVMENPYSKEFYTSMGFSAMSETLNGRLAMLGFVGAAGAIFTGDILTQIANGPLAVVSLVTIITAASLVPVVQPQGYLPEGAQKTIMEAFEGAGLKDVFSPENEMLTGRLAMVGVAGLLVLAALF